MNPTADRKRALVEGFLLDLQQAFNRLMDSDQRTTWDTSPDEEFDLGFSSIRSSFQFDADILPLTYNLAGEVKDEVDTEGWPAQSELAALVGICQEAPRATREERLAELTGSMDRIFDDARQMWQVNHEAAWDILRQAMHLRHGERLTEVTVTFATAADHELTARHPDRQLTLTPVEEP